MRTKSILLTGILILLGLSSSVFGQIVYDQPGSTSIKFFYNSWKVETITTDEDTLLFEDDLTQSSTLISGFLPLKDNFEARYFLVSSSNNVTIDENEATVSGIGDARLQLSHSFDNDRLLLSMGINLPTGKRELDSLEQTVIEFLDRDYLNVPVRRYGEGLGINLLAGGARQISRFRCGLSAMYQLNGSYTPYSDGIEYTPGNLFSINANTHFMADKINYTADFVYSRHSVAKRDGEDIFRQAPQFNGRIKATYFDEPYSTSVGVRMVFRGRNARYSAASHAIESELKRYGNEFGAFVDVAYTTGINWHILAHIETRKISGGEEEYIGSSTFNFGLSILKEFSPHFGFEVGGLYNNGSTENDLIDVKGFQITAGITAAY